MQLPDIAAFSIKSQTKCNTTLCTDDQFVDPLHERRRILELATLSQQRHALQQREVGMAFLFVVLGIYFNWFWSHGGQTLAMKTWHIRLVAHNGGAVSQRRAVARYLSSWAWFLPPLALVQWIGVAALGVGGTAAMVGAYVLVYAMLSLANSQRQFWHDVWCATRLVDVRPAARH